MIKTMQLTTFLRYNNSYDTSTGVHGIDSNGTRYRVKYETGKVVLPVRPYIRIFMNTINFTLFHMVRIITTKIFLVHLRGGRRHQSFRQLTIQIGRNIGHFSLICELNNNGRTDLIYQVRDSNVTRDINHVLKTELISVIRRTNQVAILVSVV